MAIKIIDLSAIYDLLYTKASLAMAIFNPCRIKDGRCRRGDFCCQDCPHLGQNGCTVRALACKLWLCRTAARDPGNKVCQTILQTIGEIAEYLNLNGYRHSKEQNLFPGETIIVNAEWMNQCREKLRACDEWISFSHPGAIGDLFKDQRPAFL